MFSTREPFPQLRGSQRGRGRDRRGRAGARAAVWRGLVGQGTPEGTASGGTSRDGEEEAWTGR